MNSAALTNRMNNPNDAKRYNEIARTIFFPIYPVIAHLILERTEIDRGSCLDVGSGPGYLAIALATLSDLTVYALDNARPMIGIAQKNVDKYRLGLRVKPVYGDIHAAPFNDESMALVVSRGSYFFWEDLSRGFSECLRVLKPGGIAWIGGGFGNTRLRDEIFCQMRRMDSAWELHRQECSARCGLHKVRSALAAAGIPEYDLIQDESGSWVCFTKLK